MLHYGFLTHPNSNDTVEIYIGINPHDDDEFVKNSLVPEKYREQNFLIK